MKDLEISVLMVALKYLYDFPDPFRANFILCLSFLSSLFSNKCYKASFLEPQDHARMKDLEISVLMVALKPLRDFSRPIS